MPQSWSLPKVEADDELALEVARIPVEQGLWAPVSPWNPYTHFWASPLKSRTLQQSPQRPVVLWLDCSRFGPTCWRESTEAIEA